MKIINFDELLKDKANDFFKTTNVENIESAQKIIEEVQKFGNSAIIKYSKQFNDGNFKDGSDFLVSEDEIENAYKSTQIEIIEALKFSIKNVEEFAKRQLDCILPLEIEKEDSILGHKIVPLKRVLCYVPGGNYPLPSSAIMTTIPAKVAGVAQIALTSPRIKPATIVAAHLSGATEIYKIGGVQAISAFAYGSETITPVDKIVGPGNKFVTFAKKQVYGKCSIDFLAGPSEVLVVADDKQNPEIISADLLAQCEHDKDARGYLVCFSEDFAKKVIKCAQNQLEKLETKEIAKISFEKSIAVVVKSIEEAAEISNLRAPEHLELLFGGAKEKSEIFTNFGSLFIGENCAEVFGDYCSGTNHVLPTNAAARYTGGLSVFDFVKIQTYQKISKNYAKVLSNVASTLAKTEGLMAHKLASDLRGKNEV